jgi:hypothetical protein
MSLLHRLKPSVTVELTQANVNEYVRSHADELKLPSGLADPRITFRRGHLEISARKQVLFANARLRAVLTPLVRHGRLKLEIQQMWAGPLPVPSAFHNGFADSLAALVNDELDATGARLMRIEIDSGTVRAIASLHPPDDASDCPTVN